MSVKVINGLKYVHVYSTEDSKGREVKNYIRLENVVNNGKLLKNK